MPFYRDRIDTNSPAIDRDTSVRANSRQHTPALGRYDRPTSSCQECGETVPTWFICAVEHGGIFQPPNCGILRTEACFHCFEGYPYPAELGAKGENDYIEKLKAWRKKRDDPAGEPAFVDDLEKR